MRAPKLPRLAAAFALATGLAALPACSDSPAGDTSGDSGSPSEPGGGDTGDNGGTGGDFALGEAISVDISPSSIVFGAVLFGESETRTITVTHTGSTGTLELLDVTFLTDSADLTFEGPAETALAPGETTTLQVTFTPSDTVADAATVHIETNAPSAGGGVEIFDLPISTPSQVAELLADQGLVDFGAVATGSDKLRSVILRNLGTVPVTLETLTLGDGSSPDFQVAGDALPRVVDAGSLYSVDITYTPTGQDADEGAVVCTFDAFGTPASLQVSVSGEEISAEVLIAPDPIDFGLKPPGQTHALTVTLSNVSGVPLALSDAWLVSTTDLSAAVEVDAFPETAVVLEGADTFALEVRFTPTEDMLNGPTPIAMLAVASNDPSGGGVVEVPIYGQRQGTSLEVIPGDLVSFGYVPFLASVYRDVTLYNAGNSPLTVHKVFTVGDFQIQDQAAWGPTRGAAEASELPPGGLQTLTLRYQNGDPLLESVWGKLLIESEDAVKPEWEVLLNAHKVEGGDCLIQLVPSSVDFDRVTPGSMTTRTLKLVNLGSGPCAWHSAIVDDCAAPQSCEGMSPDLPPAPGTSSIFQVTGQPADGAEVAPGATVTLEVAFEAPPQVPTQVVPYYGFLRARVTSPGDDGAPVLTTHPSADSWLNIANLHGEVGIGVLDVQPSAIDFGLVKIGCRTDTHVVTAKNVGHAALQLQGWELVGCPESVQMWAEPPTDQPIVVLPVAHSVEWVFVFEPSAEVPVDCALHIDADVVDEAVVVPLTAEASYDGIKTDQWTDSASQTVDVLFVVDDSGSMNQEQENLATSFDAFIQEAASWQSDYQIGVTTTTVAFPNGGALQGDPIYIDDSNWEKFVPNVAVGTTGSGTEQGLWAAKIALSPPLIDYTDEACATDSECGFLHECHPDGTCGGFNRGFLRDEAALEVVFVSDEEDQSPETLDSYLNFFRELKGFDRPDLLHLHAIVGPPGGCSSVNGVAQAGHRYLDLAAATGGASYSICELDFAKGLEGIGEIAFAAQMEYFLTAIPAPPTLVVTINGQLCPVLTAGTFNWVYDADENSVQLTEAGICTAAPGDLVEITYELLCFAEAGGL